MLRFYEYPGCVEDFDRDWKPVLSDKKPFEAMVRTKNGFVVVVG